MDVCLGAAVKQKRLSFFWGRSPKDKHCVMFALDGSSYITAPCVELVVTQVIDLLPDSRLEKSLVNEH